MQPIKEILKQAVNNCLCKKNLGSSMFYISLRCCTAAPMNVEGGVKSKLDSFSGSPESNFCLILESAGTSDTTRDLMGKFYC